MARLEIESRHSDYGDDAGGYRVLRFNGEWIGRITNYEEADRLLIYVASLEARNDDLTFAIDHWKVTTENLQKEIAEKESVIRGLEKENDDLRCLVSGMEESGEA